MSGPARFIDIESVVLHGVDPHRVHEVAAALEAQIALALPGDLAASPRVAGEAARAVIASISGGSYGS